MTTTEVPPTTVQLHQAECLTWLTAQPAGQFDMILADPPYRTTNLAFDRARELDWPAWWKQAWRVLKPGGAIILFADGLFTVDLIAGQRKHYRYRLVWAKTMATGFLSAEKRPLRGHEDIVVFGKGEVPYYPQKMPKQKGTANRTNHCRTGEVGHYGTHRAVGYDDDGTRYPTSVLYFDSVPTTGRLHPCQKPVPLLRFLLRSYSLPGAKVLDCFAGSGSTLEACLLERRWGVGIEDEAETAAVATQRLARLLARPELQLE